MPEPPTNPEPVVYQLRVVLRGVSPLIWRRLLVWFEVIAGKSMPSDGPAKCFSFVQTYDAKPKRRLFEVLKSQGMQMNQQVTFLTDGGEDVRDLPLYLNPRAEHLIDWFHITMRLTVMTQMAKGRRSREHPELSAEVLEELVRLKWFVWHGNVFRALQVVDNPQIDLDNAATAPTGKLT